MITMMWTSDPVRDASRYSDALEEEAARYPTCEICGNHILPGEPYYDMSDGMMEECYCEDCFREKHIRYMREIENERF